MVTRWLLVTLAAWGGAAAEAWACSCAPPDLMVTMAASDAVFIGRAEKIAHLEPDAKYREPRIRVHFAVEKALKGPRGTVIIDTVHNKASCRGYWFAEGGDYLVVARVRREGRWPFARQTLDTSFCWGTMTLAEAERHYGVSR
jgi:hypothetical protein